MGKRMHRDLTFQKIHFGDFPEDIIKIEGMQTSRGVVFFHSDGATGVDQEYFAFHDAKVHFLKALFYFLGVPLSTAFRQRRVGLLRASLRCGRVAGILGFVRYGSSNATAPCGRTLHIPHAGNQQGSL